jgi:outer membrane protein OmpA-like peptidoglycan-associated protein
MRTIIGWISIGAVAWSSATLAEDCALGQRYLALAKDRIASYANDEALTFLRQSADACPSYEASEQLGELAAQSPQREDKVKAVAAFVDAYGRAPDTQSRAHTLYEYAALLDREGDPENAYPLIKNAHTLDPSNADIAKLAGTLEAQVQHPTQEHIVRALHYSLYQPVSAAMKGEGGGGGGGAASGASAASAAQHPAMASPAMASGPSVNIPINFDTASTRVDAQTQPNINLLAHALADPSLAGRQFMFIGHSDARGADAYNADLSLQRAQTLSQMVSTIEPSLKGRISVEGHGAREPIDTGTGAAALRANRRLQVLVK